MKTRWQELRTKYWNNRPAHERRIIASVSLFLLQLYIIICFGNLLI
jgi:type II secretory pathway component PulM